MRKGLGTTDEVEADRLVGQMNRLLSDQSWWNAAKREEAARLFDPIVVSAFFDGIQAGMPNSSSLRDHIELPDATTGYSRVLLVGTTGAGKTSLLRHLIGSDPDRDRFPSTSTARTTVSDIEIVLAPGEFEAAVTFFSEFWVRTNLEECLIDACNACWDDAPVEKIAEHLLNHRDQRFRLSYALGQWKTKGTDEESDDWSFEESAPPQQIEDALPDEELRANDRRLKGYIDRIQLLSAEAMNAMSSILGKDIRALSGTEREAAQQDFGERIRDAQEFSELTDDIFRDVRSKFDLLTAGRLELHSSGWPSRWIFETADRNSMIEQIRWFSSNGASQFGRLLTPFVDGVRVRGPLFPDFTQEQPKLVLLDGQGLGHTPDSSTSVTTQITARFEQVDVVLLVDNAEQPMQAAPLSVIRSLAVGGHQHKLGIAFTHFDRVEGPNIPTAAQKKAHVLASVTMAVTTLKDILGPALLRNVERTVSEHCFILGAIDKPTRSLPNGVKNELRRMLSFFETAIRPQEIAETGPKYSPDGLLLALQTGTFEFKRLWASRLGLAHNEISRREHWTRIKALNRRIAAELDDEYDNLKPVADFLARLSEGISQFLDRPLGWLPPVPPEDAREKVVSSIKRQIYAELHRLIDRRLLRDHLREWRFADQYAGKGSTRMRALDIHAINEAGAPAVSANVSEASMEFLRDVRNIVYGAIKKHGGRLDADL